MNKDLITLHWDYESRFDEKGSIPIYIDPALVVYVRQTIAKDGTYISFTNGTSITVIEDINYVYQKVWGIS